MLLPSGEGQFTYAGGEDRLYEETDFEAGTSFHQLPYCHQDGSPNLASCDQGTGVYTNGQAQGGEFAAFSEFDDLLAAEYDTDGQNDSMEEEGQLLTFEDILAISDSDEGEGASGSQTQSTATATNGEPTAPAQNDTPADDMLSRWDVVSVTSFRLRQQQHKQRLAGHNAPPGNKGKGIIKGKMTMTDAPMTPGRRRKLRNNRRDSSSRHR